MIENFDATKGQLREVADILRGIQSEAVQLRVLEFVQPSAEPDPKRAEMEPDKSLDLWLKYRNAAEQRHYWFLLAQATVLGLVVANLDKLSTGSNTTGTATNASPLLVVSALSALAFGSAMATVASVVAYWWDLRRLESVTSLISEDRRPIFKVDWGWPALFSSFGFALFHLGVAAAIGYENDQYELLVVGGSALVTILTVYCGLDAWWESWKSP